MAIGGTVGVYYMPSKDNPSDWSKTQVDMLWTAVSSAVAAGAANATGAAANILGTGGSTDMPGGLYLQKLMVNLYDGVTGAACVGVYLDDTLVAIVGGSGASGTGSHNANLLLDFGESGVKLGNTATASCYLHAWGNTMTATRVLAKFYKTK